MNIFQSIFGVLFSLGFLLVIFFIAWYVALPIVLILLIIGLYNFFRGNKAVLQTVLFAQRLHSARKQQSAQNTAENDKIIDVEYTELP